MSIKIMSYNHKQQKGFTLVEMMISIFIFVIVMTATITVFVRHSAAHNHSQIAQKNLENAQFAFNFVAKTLRTSAVAAGAYGRFDIFTLAPNEREIYVYDFSQSACFHFYFDTANNDALTYQKVTPGGLDPGSPDIELCGSNSAYTSVDPVALTTGRVTGGRFTFRASERSDVDVDLNGVVTYNEPPSVGFVTIAAQIEDELSEEGNVWLQTTVSLRDYPGELSF